MNVYESLLDVPVDEYHDDDHDDQAVPGGETTFDAPRLLSLASETVIPDSHQAVPFVYVKAGDRGMQVVALKRALSRAGYGTWLGSKFTRLMGPFAIRSLNSFKRKHGLPANGVYDKATWQKLAPWFDAYAIRYMLNAKLPPKPSHEDLLRNAFLSQLMYLYNRCSLERYTQARPWDVSKPPYGLDCSASGEWGAKWSGMKSLSGFPGWGYGNTDSQIARFRRLNALRSSVVLAKIGDPIYYGRGGDPSHVAYWIGDSRVWSFGAYPIKILDYRYRHDAIAVCNLMAGQ